MTLHKDDGTVHRLPSIGEEQIPTYVEAVNNLLKSYAADSNIAKATSDVACLKKTSMEALVQFADLLRSKVVHCGNVYPEMRANGGFIDGLPANIRSTLRTAWGHQKDAHLLETAQYADPLLEQTRHVPSHEVASAYKNCFRRGR